MKTALQLVASVILFAAALVGTVLYDRAHPVAGSTHAEPPAAETSAPKEPASAPADAGETRAPGTPEPRV